MERMLDISDQKFKTSMTKMQRTLMDKENGMQEQRGNSSKYEILRKNEKEM